LLKKFNLHFSFVNLYTINASSLGNVFVDEGVEAVVCLGLAQLEGQEGL